MHSKSINLYFLPEYQVKKVGQSTTFLKWRIKVVVYIYSWSMGRERITERLDFMLKWIYRTASSMMVFTLGCRLTSIKESWREMQLSSPCDIKGKLFPDVDSCV
jgi:hypothetical protein